MVGASKKKIKQIESLATKYKYEVIGELGNFYRRRSGRPWLLVPNKEKRVNIIE